MQKYLYILILITFIVACSHETIDKKIWRQASEFTKNSCPKPMDEYTILDSLVYSEKERVMSYHYSVSSLMDTTAVYTTELLNIFHSNLLDNIKQNVRLMELKQHGVTFRYTYVSSTDAREYMSFLFTPEDYN